MVSKLDLTGPLQVPTASTSLLTSMLGASRGLFEALMGLIAMGVLMIPVLYYPGLFFVVIFAEVYLIDAIYSRVYGSRMEMSLSLREKTGTRKRTACDCRYVSRTRPPGLLTM
ncbi:MAG: hypothetical protein ACFFAZ_06665 [Promethearchaeota archaeon]